MLIPTVQTKVKNVMRLTMRLNAVAGKVGKGTTESWVVGVSEDIAGLGSPTGLVQTNYPDVSDIINFRLPLLGLQASMVTASLTTTKKGTNDSKLAIFAPQAPVAFGSESPIASIDRPESGLLWRFQAGLTGHAYRSFHMIRDPEIAGMLQAVTSLVTSIDGTYTVPGSNVGLTEVNAWKAYLTTLFNKTMFCAPTRGGYIVAPWTSIDYISTCNRHLGAPFFNAAQRRRL